MHIAVREGRDYTVEFVAKKGGNICIKDIKGVSEYIQLIRV